MSCARVQDNINKFSQFNHRIGEIEERLERLRKEVDDLEEVETEMELLDDDDGQLIPRVPPPSARARCPRCALGG